ncbi:MAG TPA: hypothetical protein VJ783_23915 [Pirellulales bacterium]|nr:hypothetical protein [Pirellulales bacterium]
MASIILGSGEQFEHQHAKDRKTTLRRGNVRISIGKRSEKEMEINKAVRIPASTPHRLRNVGDDYAIVDCHHEQGSRP